MAHVSKYNINEIRMCISEIEFILNPSSQFLLFYNYWNLDLIEYYTTV